MSDRFERVTPESVGIHSEDIMDFVDALRRNGIEMHSFMLLRHGRVFAEGWWKPYAPDIPHPVFSFSKSLTSTAIGFAEQEGLLRLDEKLTDIFPDKIPGNPSENLKKATLEHLLTMSCGHETEISLKPDDEGTDWLKRFFSHPFVYEPGKVFQYNTAGTNVLAAALLRKTGKGLTEYLRPRLLDPLGIADVHCALLPDGVEFGGGGYRLRTEDMARFTQFVLQRGTWRGKRLLNEQWFEKATAKQIETRGGVYQGTRDWGSGYCYQYWRCIESGAFRADGAFGQFGVVLPGQDAAVIITSSSESTPKTLDCVWDYLAHRMQDAPLPENPQSHERLLEQLQDLEIDTFLPTGNPTAEKNMNQKSYIPTETIPGLVKLIGGTGLFHIADSGPIEKLSFEFGESIILRTENSRGALSLNIGMNGSFLTTKTQFGTYASAGRWRSSRAFEVEIRCMESLSGTRFIFRFGSGELVLERDETLVTSGGADGQNSPPMVFKAID